MDVAELEVIDAKVGFVHFELIGIDIVGKGNLPAVLLQRQSDQPDSSKELGSPEGSPLERLAAGRSGYDG